MVHSMKPTPQQINTKINNSNLIEVQNTPLSRVSFIQILQ
jgi:hypothetical protein